MRAYSRQRMSYALACMVLVIQPHAIFAQEEGRPGRADSSERKRPDAGGDIDKVGRDADARRDDNDARVDRERRGEDVGRDTDDAKTVKGKLQEIEKLKEELDTEKDKYHSGDKMSEVVDSVVTHAYREHGREYAAKNTDEFRTIAIDHINNYSDKTDLYGNEATAYWSEAYKSILIDNHVAPDRSTMFKPDRGREYYDELKSKYGSE